MSSNILRSLAVSDLAVDSEINNIQRNVIQRNPSIKFGKSGGAPLTSRFSYPDHIKISLSKRMRPHHGIRVWRALVLFSLPFP